MGDSVFTKPQAIQAFRYLKRGVVPPRFIEYFTVGRDRALSQIKSTLIELQNIQSQHFFIQATYGNGKSHLLKVIESVALSNNFASTKIVTDGYAHAFNHPPRYIHGLFENLRVPNLETNGLSELMIYWLNSKERPLLLDWAKKCDYPDLKYAVFNLANHTRGRDYTYEKRLIDCRNIIHRNGQYASQFYEKIQLLCSIVMAVGLGGIVLLFDEMESIATLLTDIRSRMRSYEILNDLTNRRRFPHCCFILAVTPDLGYKINEENVKCQEYIVNRYPEAYTFTRKWILKELNVLNIDRINNADNIRLCMRLRQLHQFAYSWKVENIVSDSYIKDFVEKADKHGLFQRGIIISFINVLETCQQNPSCFAKKLILV